MKIILFIIVYSFAAFKFGKLYFTREIKRHIREYPILGVRNEDIQFILAYAIMLGLFWPGYALCLTVGLTTPDLRKYVHTLGNFKDSQ